MTFSNAYHAKDWNMAGIYIGKIVADVFFKAPYMTGWNYKNSDVLSNNWGTAPLLLNGINQVLNYWGINSIPLPDIKYF